MERHRGEGFKDWQMGGRFILGESTGGEEKSQRLWPRRETQASKVRDFRR